MSTPTRSNLLKFWALWLLVTTLGWVLTWSASQIAVEVASGSSLELAARFGIAFCLGLPGGGILGGAVTGIGQAILLRPHIEKKRWWTLATAICWAVGLPISIVVLLFLPPKQFGTSILAGLIAGGISGAIVGFGQWLVLRRRIQRAIRWIPATALAWGTGETIVFAFFLNLSGAVRPIVLGLVSGLIGGLIGGAVTGGVLLTLLPQNEQKMASNETGDQPKPV